MGSKRNDPSKLTQNERRAQAIAELSEKNRNDIKYPDVGLSYTADDRDDTLGDTQLAQAGTSFGERWQRTKEALTPKPRVTRAYDATRLASMPESVSPDLYVSAAKVYEQQNNVEKAVESYQQALRIAPQDRQALIGLARVKHRTGDFETANNIYQQVLRTYPQDAVTYNDLGLCLARQGRIQESLSALQQAVQFDPNSRLYRNNLATVLLESGRANEAYSQLAQLLGPAAANYNVGVLLQQRGSTATARDYFAKALELDPSMEPARRMLDQLAGTNVAAAASQAYSGAYQTAASATRNAVQDAAQNARQYANQYVGQYPNPYAGQYAGQSAAQNASQAVNQYANQMAGAGASQLAGQYGQTLSQWNQTAVSQAATTTNNISSYAQQAAGNGGNAAIDVAQRVPQQAVDAWQNHSYLPKPADQYQTPVNPYPAVPNYGGYTSSPGSPYLPPRNQMQNQPPNAPPSNAPLPSTSAGHLEQQNRLEGPFGYTGSPQQRTATYQPPVQAAPWR